MINTSPINVVAFEILEKCNLYCSFCVRSAHYKLTRSLSVDQFANRVKIVSKAFDNLSLIAITGGEPFLHPEVIEIVKIARLAAPNVCLTTNATVLNQSKLEQLSSISGFHLIVSLDGPSAEIHDTIRGKQGSYDRLLNFTSLCNKLGLVFLMNMTVNEINASYVYETVKVAKNLGARDISVALVKPEGRGYLIHNDQSVFSRVGYETMLSRKDFSNDKFIVRFTDPLAHVFETNLAISGKVRGCGAASKSLHIQCDGNILICTSCKESLGNIEDLNLNTINNDFRIQTISSRHGLGGNCGSCEFKISCGGCRCRAVSSNLGFLGPDMLCPKNVGSIDKKTVKKFISDLQKKLNLKLTQNPKQLRDMILKIIEDASISDAFKVNLQDEIICFPQDSIFRFIDVLEAWFEHGVFNFDLQGTKILNINSVSPGEILLLASLGARVDFCHENLFFCELVELLKREFNLPIYNIRSPVVEFNNSTNDKYNYIYLTMIKANFESQYDILSMALKHLLRKGKCLIQAWTHENIGSLNIEINRLDLFKMLYDLGFQELKIIDFDTTHKIQILAEHI